ncbi:MAG: hypothetical protein V1733_04670 [bacterium]
MKWSRILICSAVLAAFAIPFRGEAQDLSVRSGIYDFTASTTREFYLLAPTFLVGYDIWTLSRLSFHLSTGIAYNSTQYNADRHHLFMIPLFFLANYNLPNPNARLLPVIGGGFCLMQKLDKNTTLSRTHYGITYGFQANGGLRYRLKTGLQITLDIAYNLLIPFTTEETNINGFLYTFGLRIPISKKPNQLVDR